VDGLAGRHARRTPAATAVLEAVALALGGRAGACLSGRLAAGVSRMTMIRLVRAMPLPAVSASPRVLGVDEFALAASLLTGIARAWGLVGDRQTNIIYSIATLTGHPPGPPEPDPGPAAKATSTAEGGQLPARETPARPAAGMSGEFTEPGAPTPRTG